jgi:carbamoyl-phosphate synthase large subunit
VNPRVSRSSALASKATGYPIARVAAKIAIGLQLDEIENAVTRQTLACFEPALDYCVVKIPRWPFDKFALADRNIGTQMKATGEVMAIDRAFEPALMKAIRSLEIGVYGLTNKTAYQLSDMQLEDAIQSPNDERLWAITEGLRRGMLVEEIHALSGIDAWFLRKLEGLVGLESRLRLNGPAIAHLASLFEADADCLAAEQEEKHPLVTRLLREAKRAGFADRNIAELAGIPEMKFRRLRKRLGIVPIYKMVDTCAAEFEAATPYFYSCYDKEDES